MKRYIVKINKKDQIFNTSKDVYIIHSMLNKYVNKNPTLIDYKNTYTKNTTTQIIPQQQTGFDNTEIIVQIPPIVGNLIPETISQIVNNDVSYTFSRSDSNHYIEKILLLLKGRNKAIYYYYFVSNENISNELTKYLCEINITINIGNPIFDYSPRYLCVMATIETSHESNKKGEDDDGNSYSGICHIYYTNTLYATKYKYKIADYYTITENGYTNYAGITYYPGIVWINGNIEIGNPHYLDQNNMCWPHEATDRSITYSDYAYFYPYPGVSQPNDKSWSGQKLDITVTTKPFIAENYINATFEETLEYKERVSQSMQSLKNQQEEKIPPSLNFMNITYLD